jgi:hypothetical protein
VDNKKIKEFIRQNYLDYLGREPDDEGLEHFFNQIVKGHVKINELKGIIQNSDEYKLKNKENELVEIINEDLEEILEESKNHEIILKEESKEPKKIFVTCTNRETFFGGIYELKEKLIPVFEGTACYAMQISKDILFSVTREKDEQIIAFNIKNEGNYQRIPISFKNYIYAVHPHGMYLLKNKIIVVATNGIEHGGEATNKNVPWTGIGKIIVSDIEFTEKEITIKNSKVYNPFSCTHHHHINDLCMYNDSLYLSAHTYCNGEKFLKKGILAKLDKNFQASMLIDKLEQPHSPYVHRNKIFVCSSAIAAVMSIEMEQKKSQTRV